MHHTPDPSGEAASLRRHAAARVRARRRTTRSKGRGPKPAVDAGRALHELEVHQIELEMQNAELQNARDRMEALLDKYTDLYDFAPIGYFSLDDQGRILAVNLPGAAMLGVERSRLLNRRFPSFVAPPNRPAFRAFIERVFAEPGKHVCEANLVKESGATFCADLHAAPAAPPDGPQRSCRLAASDITALKRAEEAQRRTAELAAANRELRQEIVRRRAVENALKDSERHQRKLLEKSRRMQEQLRHLSHRTLQAQEEERKRISRELHDDITQTLVGINVQLENLARDPAVDPAKLARKIARTQRLVAKAVHTVLQFARELRPALLDDLGLIATVHSLVKDFTARTGIRVRFTAFAGVERLSIDRRTVLYRVAQSALANVARHAHASRVIIGIRKLPNAVCMDVTDNGASFDVQRVLRAARNRRLGLLGMRERVEMVGGSLSVVSTPGRGTTVRARVPFGGGSARGEDAHAMS